MTHPGHPRIPQPQASDWLYTERLLAAVDAAARMHAAQRRKGTGIPYLAHPFAVCSIALEHGAGEDAAIAALLHDALEDVTDTDGALAVVTSFGPEVLRIVEACTDGVPGPDGRKGPWIDRKMAYLEHLAEADGPVLLVAGADKLHNTRSMVSDLRHLGLALWERFNATPTQILWYHRELVAVMRANPAHDPRLVDDLARAVDELEALAGATTT